MAAKKVDSKSVKLVAEAAADRGSDAAKAASSLAKLKGFKRMSEGSKSQLEEVIPTGIEALDRYVIGRGGWPVKRCTEVFAPNSAGKTSLLAAGLGNTARAGGIPILIECESALEPTRFTILGCDLDDVWLSEPMSVEEVLSAHHNALDAIPTGTGPNMLGWDSLAMAQLQKVLTEGMGKKGDGGGVMGKKPALLASQVPAIIQKVTAKRVAWVVINQQRTKLGVMFGDPTTTPGGEILKYAASLRLQMFNPGKFEERGERVGILTTISTLKSKIAIPHRKTKLCLRFDRGWDSDWTTLHLAKELKKVVDGAKDVERARAALGWFEPTEEQKSEWARQDEAAKNKPKKGKKTKQEELELETTDGEADGDEYGFSSDWDDSGGEED